MAADWDGVDKSAHDVPFGGPRKSAYGGGGGDAFSEMARWYGETGKYRNSLVAVDCGDYLGSWHGQPGPA
jgi:hypothetical protein